MKASYFFGNNHMEFEVIFGTTIVILVLILFTRIFGLKSFSKMSGFDFVNTIMIGNLAGMTLNTGNPKLLIGIFIIFLIYFINWLLTRLRYRSSLFESMISNKPLLLMKDGKILHENMKKGGVTLDELRGKLREANVFKLSQVMGVILETTGDVSVLHTDGNQKEIDGFLLEDVIH